MNWYKRQDWKPTLERVHKKRSELRSIAEKKASELGHILNGWTTMESCVCRRCGSYAKINGLFHDMPEPQFYGAAFTNKCSVRFNDDDKYQWQEFSNPNPKNALV